MSETQQPDAIEDGDGAKPARKKRRRDGEPSGVAPKRRAPDRGAAPKPTEPEPPLAEDDDPPPPEDDAAPEEEESDLLPVGNPLRFVRGTLALVAGALLAFCLMAVAPQYRFGVPLGALGILIAAFGALDLAGTFDDPDDRVAGRATLADLGRPLGLFAGGAVSLFGVLCLAVDGRLSARFPILAAGVLVPASFLIAVVGAYEIAAAFGVWTAPGEAPRPMLRRHGFWLVVICTLLYLPLLGSHSLSDPWETHYGEVSREMLARNDWISTWWAQESWFWSKPVLDFWIQAMAMATFGVRYQSDRMLSAVTEGRVPWPEWAVRTPIFLLSLLAVYLLYKAVARVWGRRAGFCGGVVLLTMPQWFLLSNQTMTDMPFVAAMASAMALFLLGANEDPDDEVRVYELSLGPASLRFSGYHLVMGAIIACALPQVLYLLSRNVPLDIRGFHWQLDAFMSGSPGNCGLPGNEACRAATPVVRGLHPALQALIWAQALALLVYLNWGERRRQRLYFLAAWLFAALSTMAKGPAGFGLPVLCVLAYLAVSRRWADLLRVEIASGVLILLALALPWYVAMYVRHGQPFTDRLIFHDMFKRAFTHVHDTNEGEDVSFRFYVWQLGYATFPWVGLAPAALVYWLRRRENDRKSDAAVFMVMWFLLGFALFSLMLTKFHHYILPAVPPVAMLIGVLLDRMLKPAPAGGASPDDARGFARRFEVAQLGAAGLAGAILVAAVGRDLAANLEGLPSQIRLWHLVTYNYRRPWPPSLDFSPALWAFTGAAAVLMAALVAARVRRYVTMGLLGIGVAFALWGVDVYFFKVSPHWGQRETTLAYYQAAREAPGPFIAYQMNWKGENFYTGNHVPAFVSSGKRFQDYILEERKKGVHTFYFVTEHGRVTTLGNEIGNKELERLTTAETDNKFVLVRAKFD